jgi:RNA polymerase sigma factor (sigma-70 family)
MDAEPNRRPARADRDLLRAFVDRSDGDAFAELVARHGPLVIGVCRRVLADAPEAEDAFQATFLILARKAAAVRSPERLGSWLYGVALRCAYQARKAARRMKKQPIPDLPARETADADWADVGPVLDAEIGQLPDKLRAALVLCELQGLDRATAADRLGVPIGTVSSRLSRAKDELRRRLVRRGITLSIAALALILAQAARAAVPPPLVRQTVKAARRFAAGKDAGAPAAIANRAMRPPRRNLVPVAVGAGALVLVLVGVVLWLVFGRGRPVDDRKAIQGTWYVSVARFGGDDMRPMFGPTVTFDEKTARFELQSSGYTLDPSQKPGFIDLELPMKPDRGPDRLLGVYELQGKRLVIHLAQPGMPRPTILRPAVNADSFLLILTREPIDQPAP